MSPRRALWVVTFTYVALTVGESVLAPILPTVAPEIGLDTAGSGRVLGVLSLSAGVGNLLGGYLLARLNARVTSVVGAGFSIAGSIVAALSTGEAAFIAAHFLIGLGAGIYFAGGVFSVASLAPPGKTGQAMGRYGIAYSVALALAAGLAATLGTWNWRVAFGAAALMATIAGALVFFVDLPGADPVGRGEAKGVVRLLGAPVLVGGVAAIAQFGLVAYIPTFGVEDWALSATIAATVLLVGRLASIPGKSLAGWMVDRFGADRSARVTGLTMVGTGLAWLFAPWVVVGGVAAVLFASATGAMFPVANVVAVERFGQRGGLLGVFRSVQMVIAGASVWAVGQAASIIGLQSALAVGVLSLTVVLLVRRRSESRVLREVSG